MLIPKSRHQATPSHFRCPVLSLSILSVPSRLACCTCPILQLISILFNHPPSFALTVPCAPIIIGIIFTLLQFQIFFSSHFKAWYLSNLTSSTSLMFLSNGQDTSISRHSLFFLSCMVISGLLCSSFLSVCILKSHSCYYYYYYYYKNTTVYKIRFDDKIFFRNVFLSSKRIL